VMKINPRIIYGEITGYGTEGPWKEKPGQDLLVQSLSGATWTGRDRKDATPTPLGLAAADMFTGAHLVQGILAGLLSRNITGNGCHVDGSLLESILDLQFEELSSYLNKDRTKSVYSSDSRADVEVLNWNQMMQHEGFKVLDMVQDVRRTNGASLKTTRCPIRVDGQKFTSPRGSPTIGEHNAEIIRELIDSNVSG